MVEKVPARPRPSRGPLLDLLTISISVFKCYNNFWKLAWIWTLHTVPASLGTIFTYQTRQGILTDDCTFNITPVTYWQNRTFTFARKAKKRWEGWGVHINTNAPHVCTCVRSQSPCQRGCRCHGNTKTCFSARVTIATVPINEPVIVTIRTWCLWPVQSTRMVTYNTTFYFVRNTNNEYFKQWCVMATCTPYISYRTTLRRSSKFHYILGKRTQL
jgi:hypothetical protein